MKKHYSQMSNEEIYYLESFIRRHRKIKLTPYSYLRSKSRKLPMWLIEKTVQGGDIVEFGMCKGDSSILDCRLLIKGKANRRGISPCVVFNIHTGGVITAFLTKCKHGEDTVSTEKYERDLDIIQSIMMGEIKLK